MNLWAFWEETPFVTQAILATALGALGMSLLMGSSRGCTADPMPGMHRVVKVEQPSATFESSPPPAPSATDAPRRGGKPSTCAELEARGMPPVRCSK